jgi:type IV secretion system protein VirD4
MKRVHFILDEAASLGHLEPVDDAVDKYRGYGVRLLFIFQDMAQMKKCFPEGQEQTLLGNTTQIFFGVNENLTAEYVSTRLGETTIVVESGGTSSGSSWQQTQSAQGSASSSYSNNSNSNWQMQARRLLKPEEVMTLPPTSAIAFAPGVRPICTTLLRYYQEPGLRRREGWLVRSIAACLTLAASVALGGAALSTAAMLTSEAEKQLSASVSAPVGPRTGPNHLRHESRAVRRY